MTTTTKHPRTLNQLAIALADLERGEAWRQLCTMQNTNPKAYAVRESIVFALRKLKELNATTTFQ